MAKIWFTSDTHFFHANIAGATCSTWKSGYRNFKDQYEMSVTIANTINKYVKEDDILYHLGDWSFGGVDNIKKARDMVICKNINLIYGNHDDHIKKNSITNGVHAQSLFDSCQSVLELNIGKQKLFLSHYAHRVWLGSHKGIIHLYGHSHGSIPDYGKSMDVGIDSAYKLFKEYRPFCAEEILDIMVKKQITFPDHHSLETNMK